MNLIRSLSGRIELKWVEENSLLDSPERIHTINKNLAKNFAKYLRTNQRDEILGWMSRGRSLGSSVK